MNAREGVQDECVFKHDASTRQPVEIGRAHLVAAIGAQVHPTQVIGEDENDVRWYSRVWSRFLPRRRTSTKHKREQCRQREQAYLGIVRNSVPTQGPGWEQVKTIEEAPNGLSIPELMARVNLSKGRIEKTIALLSLEAPAPLAKQGVKWQLTAANISEAFWSRAERLTALRQDELQQMRDYVSKPFGEHMGFLISALDGDPGGVAAPALPPLPSTVNTELVKKAVEFLRRTSLPITPRKKWPGGGMPHYGVRDNILPDHLAQIGKALCVWGDAGWGGLVEQGKYVDDHFSDDLIAACVEMIKEWNPQPAPSWVTCVPSLRHPNLVPNFAKRLAFALDLPFHAVIVKTDARPEQKTMANATQQARNIDGSLALLGQFDPSAPVLLVDDIVDSRWTLTVSAWLLRKNGSGEVWPMALSQAG